jgi:threonine aldolase
VRRIDLRSDTVTQPSIAMREAMAQAEVGDDVYGEDPTVNRLQQMAAERLGHEAALFVPSGTMANQIALRVHTTPGQAVIIGEGAHLFLYEAGAGAAISGVQFTIVGEGGLFDADDVREGLHPRDDHFAETRLVCVENTHNRGGGRVFPLERVRAVASAAREAGLRLHMDGARLFNAEAATGIPAREWAAPFDSVSFCLSKGLGAPVGSLRQAGVLAAAGILALEQGPKRLADDHANAQRLAAGLRQIPNVELQREPETNMVLFRVPDVAAFVAETRRRDLLINPIGPRTLRAVTHLDVSTADIDAALERIGEVFS